MYTMQFTIQAKRAEEYFNRQNTYKQRICPNKLCVLDNLYFSNETILKDGALCASIE